MIKNKHKICAFYASDYHFEMVALPHINKSIEENKNVIIFSENDLTSTVNDLISKMNLNDSKKSKILKLNWSNNDLEKLKVLKESNKDSKDIVVYIKGKKNYIENINNNIEKYNNYKSQIVDCYDIEEVKDDMEHLIPKYDKTLGVLGQKDL